MKIATWNINGIKARHPNLIEWLKQESPDIACLQEIKSVDENFPREEIESLGYNLETHGQKSFNGVALLSKLPFDEVKRGLPLISESDEPDEQARFIEGVFSIEGGAIRVASLYLPNGNPVDTEKFPYKLKWMERLEAWTRDKLENNGIRIDHLLMSPEAAKLLKNTDIDKHVRDWEKPSDHVPAWVVIAA